jgi:hypothetical protein
MPEPEPLPSCTQAQGYSMTVSHGGGGSSLGGGALLGGGGAALLAGARTRASTVVVLRVYAHKNTAQPCSYLIALGCTPAQSYGKVLRKQKKGKRQSKCQLQASVVAVLYSSCEWPQGKRPSQRKFLSMNLDGHEQLPQDWLRLPVSRLRMHTLLTSTMYNACSPVPVKLGELMPAIH